mgnify:CR=1 FL=1
MSNPGLPTGFVRFGTLAHKILLVAHRDGETSWVRLLQEFPDKSEALSTNLRRLEEHGFLHLTGRVREGDHRLFYVYQIERPIGKRSKVWDDPLSDTERKRRYKLRRRRVPTSVFEFRGKIPLR